MKRDTQQTSGVRKPNASPAPIGEPRGGSSTQERKVTAAPVQISISSKYIDSRLKQFCLR